MRSSRDLESRCGKEWPVLPQLLTAQTEAPANDAPEEFARTYQPIDNINYEWVKRYAKFNFERLVESADALDRKSESMIKVLGGGTGLLTFGAISNIETLGIVTSGSLCTAVFFGLLAILSAAWARKPRDSYLPPDIRWALAYADHYDGLAEVKFLAQWHSTCELLRVVIEEKAKWVSITFWFSSAALAAIVTAFLAEFLRVINK